MHLFVQQITVKCKKTAFVSLFYIFINMKPCNASNSSVVVVGLLLIMQISKLFHWKATPTRAFNEFLCEFLRIFSISENSLKFAIFFAEVTNSRSMVGRLGEGDVRIARPSVWPAYRRSLNSHHDSFHQFTHSHSSSSVRARTLADRHDTGVAGSCRFTASDNLGWAA